MISDARFRRFHAGSDAGHSSIAITQRRIHPQVDAIERAFAEMGSKKRSPRVVTRRLKQKTMSLHVLVGF